MKPLFFDMESFSEADIRKTGAARYVRDPTTEPLMITWCYETGPVHYHDIANDGPVPSQLAMDLVNPEYTKIAANIPFDRGLLEETCGITIPWDQCRDAFALAYSLGFTGGLSAIGAQVGLPEDKSKMEEGRKLILRFCKPQPKNHNVRRWTKQNDPEKWDLFRQYAIQDTEALRALWQTLEPHGSMSDYEWGAWHDTQIMNERGLPIDPALVDTAITLVELRKEDIKDQLIQITGLENPNSTQQLCPWLSQMYGVTLPNMQASTIDNALASMPDGVAKQVLYLKRTMSQTASSKWLSIQRMLCADNTVKGMFTYRGASRTGRDASRGVNLQNLRRPPAGDMDSLIQLVYRGDNDLIQLVEGEPMDFLSRTVRGAITAPEGHMLVVSDLASIESRVLGWLAGCPRMNQIFREGRDSYKDFAMELFSCEYDQVTKKQRTFSKPPVLGAGYMMGGKGLAAYAESMGVAMPESEAQHAVDVFRSIYPEIPKLWRWIVDTLWYVITSGNPHSDYGMTLRMQDDFLFITLPSGRDIAYFKPEWGTVTAPFGETQGFSYMGINRFNMKWCRISAHAGGMVENIVQGIARDILIEWVRRCRDLHTVARVHDEFIVVTQEQHAEDTLRFMNEQAALPLPWAQDLLLRAEGFITKHYTKD